MVWLAKMQQDRSISGWYNGRFVAHVIVNFMLNEANDGRLIGEMQMVDDDGVERGL